MPLRVLYLDMNSYFASVEQQLRPELRNRPVVVAALDVDTTCCIAASYEAKRLGIKTGTPVWEARECRALKVVESRPDVYVRMHDRIKDAVDTCIPIQAVHSIDEMSCRLAPAEMEPDRAIELALRVKRAIREQVGDYLKCSIGLAPNRFLAKVAADMQKPDGLTVLRECDLPQALFRLQLGDLPGIGPAMFKRLQKLGISSIEQLCKSSEGDMREIWNGILGRRWWHWLRGDDLQEMPTHHGSISRSHVLSPKHRTEEGAHAVLVRLIHRIAHTLRRDRYWAGRMEVFVALGFRARIWRRSIALGSCQDTQTMLEALNVLWQLPTDGSPTKVDVALTNLLPESSASAPLFPAEQRRRNLSQAVDRANLKFGADSLYFGAMFGMAGASRPHIAFGHVPQIEQPTRPALMRRPRSVP